MCTNKILKLFTASLILTTIAIGQGNDSTFTPIDVSRIGRSVEIRSAQVAIEIPASESNTLLYSPFIQDGDGCDPHWYRYKTKTYSISSESESESNQSGTYYSYEYGEQSYSYTDSYSGTTTGSWYENQATSESGVLEGGYDYSETWNGDSYGEYVDINNSYWWPGPPNWDLPFTVTNQTAPGITTMTMTYSGTPEYGTGSFSYKKVNEITATTDKWTWTSNSTSSDSGEDWSSSGSSSSSGTYTVTLSDPIHTVEKEYNVNTVTSTTSLGTAYLNLSSWSYGSYNKIDSGQTRLTIDTSQLVPNWDNDGITEVSLCVTKVTERTACNGTTSYRQEKTPHNIYLADQWNPIGTSGDGYWSRGERPTVTIYLPALSSDSAGNRTRVYYVLSSGTSGCATSGSSNNSDPYEDSELTDPAPDPAAYAWLTISIANKTVTYSGNPQPVTATASHYHIPWSTPIPITLSYTGINGTIYPTSTTAPTNVGSYFVVAEASYFFAPNNYTYEGIGYATLTINRAPLTVAATVEDKYYDGTTAATLTSMELTGLKNSETLGFTYEDVAFTSKDVNRTTYYDWIYNEETGDWDEITYLDYWSYDQQNVVITGIQLSNGTGLASNYTLSGASPTTATAWAYIMPKLLTVVAPNRTREYGEPNPAWVGTVSGFIAGENESNALAYIPVSGQWNTSITANAGTVNGTVFTTYGQAHNYEFPYINALLTVTKAPLVLVAEDKSKESGQPNPPLTWTATGFKNSQTASVLTGVPDLTTTATDSSGAGTYPITISTGTLYSTNYSFAFVNGELEITGPAGIPVTFSAAPLTFIYNGQSRAPVITASIPAATYTVSGTSSAIGVGSYSFTVTATSGYSGTATFNWQITPATITITAQNQSRVYGSANPTPVISYSGFVNGETTATAAGFTPATASHSATATATATVGTTHTISVSGGSAANYSVIRTNGVLSITPAQLTITAQNQSRTYGSANPAPVITYSGFVNGETTATAAGFTSATASHSSTATPTANAGSTHTITVSGGSATNYAITRSNGILSITPAQLTITAQNQSRNYGSANPTPVINYSGFVNGENQNTVAWILPPAASHSVSATALAYAGTTHPITVSGGTTANYTTIRVNGVLTITKVSVTARADDQSRAYGAPNPAPTITYTGFVNGETPATAPAFTPPAATHSALATADAPGGSTLPISVTGGISTNYSFIYQSGTLTILAPATPGTITIVATPAYVAKFNTDLDLSSPVTLTITITDTTITTLGGVMVIAHPVDANNAQTGGNVLNETFSITNLGSWTKSGDTYTRTLDLIIYEHGKSYWHAQYLRIP